jgi:hypothetical protein
MVMLNNKNASPIGLGMIKLVHLLPKDKSQPSKVGEQTSGGYQEPLVLVLLWHDDGK